jgi:hypothetical protein
VIVAAAGPVVIDPDPVGVGASGIVAACAPDGVPGVSGVSVPGRPSPGRSGGPEVPDAEALLHGRPSGWAGHRP